MNNRAWVAGNAAARLLAGSWTSAAIAAGLNAVLGRGGLHARKALTVGLTALGDRGYPPAPAKLTAFLIGSPHFQLPRLLRAAAVLDSPRFAPAPPFADLPIPALPTLGDLAAWLGQSAEQLDWMSGERRVHVNAADEPLLHYRYAFIPKASGPPRLIEAPKPRLKAIQRRILREILSPVPVHDRAMGFTAGRSCLDGAQVHASEFVVATYDLVGFFPSIRAARVHGLFRRLGYPWAVARRLTGLCTTVTPAAVLHRLLDPGNQTSHAVPHLPQGAPTSPALANLLAWTLDRRLHGLARAAGANYTRYADDLAFSGDVDFAAGLGRFGKAVAAIAGEEGFTLNAAKTRIMPRDSRQRVTGIVVNAHCNVGRAQFDSLKAVLHNCARHGPAGQNRDGVPDFRRHLDGRVAWVEQVNPPRGAKLRQLFDGIDWRAADAPG